MAALAFTGVVTSAGLGAQAAGADTTTATTQAPTTSSSGPVEVPGLDTASSTTWREPDGSYKVTIKAAPYQFRNSDGSWQPIDNSLVTDSAPGEALKTKASPIETELPAAANGPLTVHAGTSSATLTLNGAAPSSTPTTSGASATYSSALSGVTVHDAVQSTGVAETDVLSSSSSPASLTWTLADTGLVPVSLANGSIELKGANQASTLYIDAPKVTDASGATGPVTMTLTGSQLTVSIDQGWLDAPSRVFPVSLDPTVSGAAGEFCGIFQANQNEIDCSNDATQFSIGQQSTGAAQRLVLQEGWAVSGAFNTYTPTNATVTSATAGFYVTSVSASGSPGPGPPKLALYPINAGSDGQEGYEFGSQSWANCVECDGSDWIPGGDYMSNYPYNGADAQGTPVANSWLLFHPIEAVQRMVSGSFGTQVELMATNESTNPGVASIDTGWDSANPPYLTFTYTIQSTKSAVSQTQCAITPSNPAVGIASAGGVDSYWTAEADGGVCPHNAPQLGSEAGDTNPIVGIASTGDFDGYWLVDKAGTVYAFGDAKTYAQSAESEAMAGTSFVSAPAVGIAIAADDEGYWVVQSNGDVISYGTPAVGGFNGPTTGTQAPSGTPTFVGIGAGPISHNSWISAGYWLVDSTGHVYVYGQATNFPGGVAPNYGQPYGSSGYPGYTIESVVTDPAGTGYWITDGDGDVYAYGSAGSTYGDLSTSHYNSIGGMAMSPDGAGYTLFSTDGSAYAFGDAALPSPTQDGNTYGDVTTGVATTGALSTTGAHDVVVAFVGINGPASGGQSVVVAGGGLTWKLVQRQNTGQGDVEIWSATAGSQLINQSFTSTPAITGYDQFIQVFAFKGAVGVGAAASVPSSTVVNSGGTASVPLTTTGSNSLVYGIGFDSSADRQGSLGTPANQSIVYKWPGPGSTPDVTWVQDLTSPVATADNLVTMSTTGLSTDNWNMAAVEIVANPASPNANINATGPDPYVGMAAVNDYSYWTVDNYGDVYTFGPGGAGYANFYGSLPGIGVHVSDIVGIAATPDWGGYWLVGADGGVFAFGDAGFYGSMAGKHLNAPVVGITASTAGSPGDYGYWMVAADGGVFSFGPTGQGFYGSMAGQQLNKPVVGIAAVAQGNGYWLAAADGGVFALGAAGYYGSMGGQHLNSPVVGIDATDIDHNSSDFGYALIAADGGEFNFHSGLPGITTLPSTAGPVVGMASDPSPIDNAGFWEVSAYGGVYTYGSAQFEGAAPAEVPPPPPTQTKATVPNAPAQSHPTNGGGNPASNQVNPCAGDPVDCSTGDFSETVDDVAMPSYGPAADLSRTYNSIGANHAGMFGFGWSSTYDMNLQINPIDGSVLATEANGSTVDFLDTSTGYVAPPGDLATLTYSSGTDEYTLVIRNDLTYTFSGTGQLQAITDLNGNTTQLSYSAATDTTPSQLQSVTDPSGRTLAFTFGANGMVSEVCSDPIGQCLGYTYDANDNLTEVVDRALRPTYYTYDANHLMLTVKDANTNVTTNVYDGEGRVVAQTNPLNQTTTWDYAGDNASASGGTTTITDTHGSVTLEVFVAGQMVSRTVGDGTVDTGTWTYTYDPLTGGQTSVTDPNGNTSYTTYDASGNVMHTEDALGHTTSATFNNHDLPLSSTDAMGIVTSYSYQDANGTADNTNGVQLTQKVVTANGTCTSGCTQTTTYFPCVGDCNVGVPTAANNTDYVQQSYEPGELEKVTDPAGHVTEYAYDTYGDTSMTVTFPSGTTGTQADITEDLYNPAGEKICELSPTAVANGDADSLSTCSATPYPKAVSEWTYNNDGQVSSSTDGDGRIENYTYDADGNQLGQSDQNQGTDNNGGGTETTYDALGRVLTKTTGLSSLSTRVITTYAYDIQPCSIAQVSDVLYCSTETTGNQVVKTYYNADNNVVATSGPVASQVTSMTYDPAQNLATKTTAAGTATYGYDADNRLTTISYSTAPSGFAQSANVTEAYDADGNRTSMTDGSGSTTYTYDGFERRASEASQVGSILDTLTFGYDADGEPTTTKYPDNTTVTDAYDQAGDMTSVNDGASPARVTDFAYLLTSPSGGPQQVTTYPDGVTVTSNLDPAGHEASISASSSAGTNLSVTYAIDPVTGLVNSETDGGNAWSANQISYTYNSAYQLTNSTSTASPAIPGDSGSFAYDGSANPTGVVNPNSGAAQTQTFNSGGELTQASSTTGTSTYSYDALGDRTSDAVTGGSTTNYQFNQAGQLASATVGSTNYTYAYNGDGLRMSKSLGSHIYTYDTRSSIPELLSDNSTYYIYGPDGAVIETDHAGVGTPTFYVHDALGSTRALFDSSGNLLATYSYNAYGSVVSKTGTSTTPIEYEGGYADSETGFLYLVNRYYDPATAQFVSQDPDLSTTNAPYYYAGDDPVNADDPTGLICWGWCTFSEAYHAIEPVVGKIQEVVGYFKDTYVGLDDTDLRVAKDSLQELEALTAELEKWIQDAGDDSPEARSLLNSAHEIAQVTAWDIQSYELAEVSLSPC